MRLAEFVLQEDRRLDLAEMVKARDWLFSLNWWPRHVGDDGKQRPFAYHWSDAAQAEWQPNVNALRSLAPRLLGTRKVRRPVDGFSPFHADVVLRQYLALMRFHVAGGKLRAGKPQQLSAASVNVTAWPTVVGPHGERLAVQPWPARFWENDLRVFWQCVFYSLVMTGHFPVCADCGQPLPETTKTGRRGRQSVCGRCRYQRWERRQPKASLREKWRTIKRENRRLN